MSTDTTTAPVGTQVLVGNSSSWWVWAVIPIVVIVVGGIWYFNPGYAGRTRFGMERSVAVMDFVRDKIKAEFLKL